MDVHHQVRVLHPDVAVLQPNFHALCFVPVMLIMTVGINEQERLESLLMMKILNMNDSFKWTLFGHEMEKNFPFILCLYLCSFVYDYGTLS